VVPERLQGRVNSAYRLVSWGTLSVGAAAGGLVVAQLGPDEFLVAGSDVRARFSHDASKGGEIGSVMRVEEGTFGPGGEWVMTRVWNGDQTDYGLNFTATPVLLKVKMGTYR
jgi:hypothetical protein